jgi:Transcriptional regulatory protein, C terminal
MSKKINRYVIIPAFFFCIGGGTLFAFLASHPSDVQQQALSERINLALRRTAHLLLKQAGDSTTTIEPVKQTADNTYQVRLEHAFNYDSLPAFLQKSFDLYNITDKYDVQVRDCREYLLVLGYKSVDFTDNNNVPCVGRDQTHDCLNFSVTFSTPSVLGVGYWGLGIGLGGLFVLGMALTFYFYNQSISKKSILLPKNEAIQVENTDLTHLITIGESLFDVHNQTVLINNIEQKLTFQESKLLELFCNHKNELLERETILKAVWGDEGVMITRSVDVFVSRLRKILKPDATLKIANVHGRGYRFETV